MYQTKLKTGKPQELVTEANLRKAAEIPCQNEPEEQTSTLLSLLHHIQTA